MGNPEITVTRRDFLKNTATALIAGFLPSCLGSKDAKPEPQNQDTFSPPIDKDNAGESAKPSPQPEKQEVAILKKWETKIGSSFLLPETDSETQKVPNTLWIDNRFFTISGNGEVVEHDSKTGKILWQFGHPSAILGAGQGRLLVVDSSLTVTLLDSGSKKTIRTIKPNIIQIPKEKLLRYWRWPARINENAIVVPRGRTIEGTNDGFIVYDLEGKFLWETPYGKEALIPLELIKDTIIAGGESDKIYLYEVKTGKKITEIPAYRLSKGKWAYASADDYIFSVSPGEFEDLNSAIRMNRASITNLKGEQVYEDNFYTGLFLPTIPAWGAQYTSIVCVSLCNLKIEKLWASSFTIEQERVFFFFLTTKGDNEYALHGYSMEFRSDGQPIFEGGGTSGNYLIIRSSYPAVFGEQGEFVWYSLPDGKYIKISIEDIRRGKSPESEHKSGEVWFFPTKDKEEPSVLSMPPDMPFIDFLGISGDNFIFTNWSKRYYDKKRFGEPTVAGVDRKTHQPQWQVRIPSDTLLHPVVREDAIFLFGESLTRVDAKTGRLKLLDYIGLPISQVIDTGSTVLVVTKDNRVIGYNLSSWD